MGSLIINIQTGQYIRVLSGPTSSEISRYQI